MNSSHPIDPGIRIDIQARLAGIDTEYGVRVLYACDSGSRGWGFASPDSDYDVRFIYVHSLQWYLQVGEGFDHPPLDTLVLAMPVSWKGTLQQYAGRLHREHATKTDVRSIDFVDTGHPALLRMWDKRQRGYRAMGYRIAE